MHKVENQTSKCILKRHDYLVTICLLDVYLASITTLCSQYQETKFGHMSTFLSIILHHFVLNIIGHFFETKFGHMSTKQKQLCEVYFFNKPLLEHKAMSWGDNVIWWGLRI